MRQLILFTFLVTIASCSPDCSTCGTKNEGRRIKRIKREAIKMEKEMNRRAKG